MATTRRSKPTVAKDEFEARLAVAGLTKLRFSELTGQRRENVIRWRKIGAPAWTTSWLMLYANTTNATRKKIEEWADFIPP